MGVQLKVSLFEHFVIGYHVIRTTISRSCNDMALFAMVPIVFKFMKSASDLCAHENIFFQNTFLMRKFVIETIN